MNDRRCRYCRQAFQPNRYHPQQQVCTHPVCQRQRRSDYHRQKIVSDPVYQQVCLESPQKWRRTHPAYWTKYRQDHPEQVERNRRKQRLRDQKRRLANLLPLLGRCLRLLANNILLVSPLGLGYEPAPCCQSSSSRASGYRHFGMVLLGPYWKGSRKRYRR